jgi:hypothetical protein
MLALERANEGFLCFRMLVITLGGIIAVWCCTAVSVSGGVVIDANGGHQLETYASDVGLTTNVEIIDSCDYIHSIPKRWQRRLVCFWNKHSNATTGEHFKVFLSAFTSASTYRELYGIDIGITIQQRDGHIEGWRFTGINNIKMVVYSMINVGSLYDADRSHTNPWSLILFHNHHLPIYRYGEPEGSNGEYQCCNRSPLRGVDSFSGAKRPHESGPDFNEYVTISGVAAVGCALLWYGLLCIAAAIDLSGRRAA